MERDASNHGITETGDNEIEGRARREWVVGSGVGTSPGALSRKKSQDFQTKSQCVCVPRTCMYKEETIERDRKSQEGRKGVRGGEKLEVFAKERTAVS